VIAYAELLAAADRVTDDEIRALRSASWDAPLIALCDAALDSQREAAEVVSARRMVAIAIAERAAVSALTR
jgi:hypothetical protein